MKHDLTSVLRLLQEDGFRPGAIAKTHDGIKVYLISPPYTDGEAILILGRTNPDDATTWLEIRVEDLVIVQAATTPDLGTDSSRLPSEPTHDP